MWKPAANRRAVCMPSACCRDKKDFTLDSLIAAAYDSYLPWFEKPLPALIKAWDDSPGSAIRCKAKLAEQIALLRTWDLRWAR